MMNYNNLVILENNYIIWKNYQTELVIPYHKSIYVDNIILNEELFIKKYIKILKQSKVSTFFLNKTILIIFDSEISPNDLTIIKNVFNNMNYKKVVVKSDISFIKISKKDNYLLINKQYKLYYIDKYNNKRMFLIDKKANPNELNIMLCNRSYNKNLFIIGNINKTILHNDLNYYTYDSFLNYCLQFVNVGK